MTGKDLGIAGLEAGFCSGLGALTAVTLSSPLGPVLGAICGISGYLAGRPVESFVKSGCKSPLVGIITNIALQILVFSGVTFALAYSFGVYMTGKSIAAFSSLLVGLVTSAKIVRELIEAKQPQKQQTPHIE